MPALCLSLNVATVTDVVVGGGGVPANATVDEDGNYILDEDGNYIVYE